MADETIDEEMAVGLEGELIASLTNRFKNEETFDPDLLSDMVKDVIDEVKEARNYPSNYTEQMINEDLYELKAKIKKIAIYDYSKDGADGETSHSENGISRSYTDRDKLFNGIRPFIRVF